LKKVAAKLNITKKMSMHIARHSFGNISGDKIPIQMLQKLYRHLSVTIKPTSSIKMLMTHWIALLIFETNECIIKGEPNP